MARGKRSVSAVLEELRLEAGLSVNGLARQAGVQTSALARILSEERQHVRFSTVARIVAALGVTLDEVAIRAGLIKAKKIPPRSAPPASAAARDDLDRLDALLERGRDRIKVIKKRLN